MAHKQEHSYSLLLFLFHCGAAGVPHRGSGRHIVRIYLNNENMAHAVKNLQLQL